MGNGSDDQAEALMGLVHHMATVVMSKPKSQWEAAFTHCRKVGEDSALSAGMTAAQAREAGEKMEEFTRALVGIIEAGGAGAGGNA